MKIFNKVFITVLIIAFTLGLTRFIVAATKANLGAADNFVILAGSTITNTGSSVISGDLGLSPGSSVTGFPPGVLGGTQHVSDATSIQAQSDLIIAYNNVAGQTPVYTIATELGGTTRVAGIYNSADGKFTITGKLILDAQGDPNAVFIFKTASTLITAAYSEVALINGAQACNVFWQVGSSATLGINSIFKGNILALTFATLTTGANVEGRILAQGPVALDTNIITKAICVVPPTTQSGGCGNQCEVSYPTPLISVKEVPTPLSLPTGPGQVTYNYTVFNAGVVAMSNITLSGNKCSNINYISGDTNNDSKLDVNEIWKYSCVTTLSQTTTNTVVATGMANNMTAADTANTTVIIGASLTPPLIHLIKTPSVFVLPSAGAVSYSYTVTNPGIVALNNVSVVDNKCNPISGHSGDINSNGLLDTSETWVYTCQTNLSANTVNVATAEGSANGLTAIDFSLATVVVTPPQLPNTGFPPENKILMQNIVIFIALVLVSVPLAITLKKRKI